jgi:xanthine dehydrogenase accessory factor
MMRRTVTRSTAIVTGAGEIGSAVAIALYRSGLAVVLCDEADPPWILRGMAFANAWYIGTAELDGEAAVFCASVKSIPSVIDRQPLIAATTWSWQGVAAALLPVVVVDARMRNGVGCTATAPADLLTIGVGPGFDAGGNVGLAVESMPGDRLGAIVESGPTASSTHDVPLLAGAGRERFAVAANGGRFSTAHRIGDRVVAGEPVGAVGTKAVRAPLTGVLRGLAARGARVAAGMRLVEVDPRGDPVQCFGLSDRAIAIAHGVAGALVRRGLAPAVDPFGARARDVA